MQATATNEMTDAGPPGAVVAVLPEPELRLVERAQSGDRAAFSELYERYFRTIHGVVLARIPAFEVRDVVQEVFLHAFERLGTLREPSKFGPWLAAIARKRAAQFHRRRRPSETLAQEPPGRSAPAPETLALLTALRSLPEAYREIMVLRLVEGMGGNEIAARTGRSPESVRVSLHRGAKKLRALLVGGQDNG